MKKIFSLALLFGTAACSLAARPAASGTPVPDRNNRVAQCFDTSGKSVASVTPALTHADDAV